MYRTVHAGIWVKTISLDLCLLNLETWEVSKWCKWASFALVYSSNRAAIRFIWTVLTKCTVTCPATTCLATSLKNLDSCKTLIACKLAFMVLLRWRILRCNPTQLWCCRAGFLTTTVWLEIPAQLANCFSLVSLYVFCADLVFTAWLLNFPAWNNVLLPFQKPVIQQLLWARPVIEKLLKVPNGEVQTNGSNWTICVSLSYWIISF